MNTYQEGYSVGHMVGLNRIRDRIIREKIYDPMEILNIIDAEAQKEDPWEEVTE